MLQRRRCELSCFNKIKAFTLMEVLIALSITAISLVPLLHLLVRSISVMDSASCLSQASLIGNAKLAEVIGSGYPEIGSESGFINNKDSNVVYKWQVNVTDSQPRELVSLGLSELRKVNVAVVWNEGQRKKQVSLSTFVTNEQMVTETNLQRNSNLQQLGK